MKKQSQNIETSRPDKNRDKKAVGQASPDAYRDRQWHRFSTCESEVNGASFMQRVTSVILFITVLLISPLAHGQDAGPMDGPPPNDATHAGMMSTAPAITNPLADETFTTDHRMDAQAKYDFSKKIDLEPFRTLPVMHNSRVGILDTLARDTIKNMAGRGSYIDYVRVDPSDEKSDIEKLRYDPLFTLIDTMADFAYYWDKPILHVEYLELRRGLLKAEYPDDPELQERMMKLTRLSYVTLQNQRQRIIDVYSPDSKYANGLGQLNYAVHLLTESYKAMNIIPPPAGSDEWGHFSQSPKVAAMCAELGRAWRAGDSAKSNAMIVQIADAVHAINSEACPPDWRLNLEALYNGSGKFMLGYTLYFFAMLSLLIAFGTNRKSLYCLGTLLLLGGLAIHTAIFIIRWIIAERVPIQNQFESMMGLCLAGVLFGTIYMLVRKRTIFGVSAAAIGFLTLLSVTTMGIPGQEIQREAAILNTSYILFYHVNTILFGYGLIAMGAIVSLVFLISHYMPSNTEATEEQTGSRFTLLKDLDQAQMVILQLAFWILGVGILLGAWWADHSWGRWWAFDPKETWALITWIIYLIAIHVRYGAKNRGLVTAWLSVIGFFVMLWTYFGVNLLLSGLHAYA